MTLTVNGEPVADIVPHQRRAPWLSGPLLRQQLVDDAADWRLLADLDQLAGDRLADL